ncbi:hypothetical protein ACIQHF_19520 [Pseudarthrobacter oxydans]|uniref:hypothetical protein n=1 Tax=Pseudarthrobacter oxydans TaxID=1671 RepID=UPI0037FD1765
MTVTLPLSVTFRRAVPADFPEVRRITRDANLRAGHFPADHPYRLFAVRGEMDPWNERHAAVLTALLKRITDL